MLCKAPALLLSWAVSLVKKKIFKILLYDYVGRKMNIIEAGHYSFLFYYKKLKHCVYPTTGLTARF